jgi:hypothetical protein
VERSGIPDTIKMSEAAGRSYGDSIEQLRSFEQLPRFTRKEGRLELLKPMNHMGGLREEHSSARTYSVVKELTV